MKDGRCGVAALLLLASAFSPRTARAQPEAPAPSPSRPNAVQLDLGMAVVGLAYERTFGTRLALQLEGQIFGTWFGPLVDLPDLSGFGGQVRPTFFVTKDAPRGVYVAPFVRVNRVSGESRGVTDSNVGWSAGAFGGYSFLFGDRFNLRIGAGVQYMSYVVRPAGDELKFRTVFPALDLVLGYTF